MLSFHPPKKQNYFNCDYIIFKQKCQMKIIFTKYIYSLNFFKQKSHPETQDDLSHQYLI